MKDRSIRSHFDQIIKKHSIGDPKLCETVFAVVVQKCKKGGGSKKGSLESSIKSAPTSSENQGKGHRGRSNRKLAQPFSDDPSVNRNRRKAIVANKRHPKQLCCATIVSQDVGV
ncbi:hypothetical protein ACHAWF_017275 [Thalassiosira exigua]